MSGIGSQQLERFIHAAHRIAAEGLVRGASGNLSWRATRDRVLVTATGSWLGELSEEDVVVCAPSGDVVRGARPTMESGIHLGVLERRPDSHVVLHFQSVAVTALACATPLPDLHVTPEVPYYLGEVAVVPYERPGSEALAGAVTSALAEHDAALLESHGAVVVGADFREATQRAITFDTVADVVLRLGERTRTLPDEAIDALRALRAGGRGV